MKKSRPGHEEYVRITQRAIVFNYVINLEPLRTLNSPPHRTIQRQISGKDARLDQMPRKCFVQLFRTKQ